MCYGRKGDAPMEEKRLIIAENISSLRRSSGLTQAELAERLNYSDKAVSKWERGDSIPDVLVLAELAEMFSVTVDYFLHPHAPDEKKPKAEQGKKRLHLAISLTACAAPVFIATVLFVILKLAPPDAVGIWRVFIASMPAVAILAIIFTSIWSKRKTPIFLSISALLWSTILLVYVFIMSVSYSAMLFILGVPLQLIVILWYFIVKKR